MVQLFVYVQTFQRKDFLVELLESIDAQTDKEFSVHLHINGGIDGTKAEVERWCRSTSVPATFSEDPVNDVNSLAALRRATRPGTWTLVPGDDDVLLPHHVAAIRDLAERSPSSWAICMSCTRFSGDRLVGNLFAPPMEETGVMLGRALLENPYPWPAAAIRFDLVGPHLHTSFRFVSDWWCMLIALCGGGVATSQQISVRYRQHESQETRRATGLQHDAERALMRLDFVRSPIFVEWLRTAPECSVLGFVETFAAGGRYLTRRYDALLAMEVARALLLADRHGVAEQAFSWERLGNVVGKADRQPVLSPTEARVLDLKRRIVRQLRNR